MTLRRRMMSTQVEVWRVNTIEGVFETDLETLKQWISEGAVQPTDKVSKGNLSWIEAGRAPMLRSAFAGEVAAPKPPITLVPAPQQPIANEPVVTGPRPSVGSEFVKPEVMHAP